MNQSLLHQAQIETLENGLTLATAPFPKVKTVTIHAWVLTGSAHEDLDKSGISHFLEHMIFRGNEVLGTANQLSLKMEELGGEINAATGHDSIEFWLEFHKNFLEEGIRRFCKFLLYPKFEELEIERSIILEEIKSNYNDENQLIEVDSLTALNLWPRQAMGLPISGLPSTVENIDLKDLKSWYGRHFQAGNLIFGISGDFNPQDVKSWIAEEMAILPPGPRNPWPEPKTEERGGVFFYPDRDNQYNFQWSFSLKDLAPLQRTAAQLLTRMLDDGSSTRLQRLIREEKGLVYEISASNFFYYKGGLLQIQGQVGHDRMEELVTTLAQVIQQVLTQGFNEEELQLARLRMQTGLDCFTDNAEGILVEKITPLLNPCGLEVEELQRLLELVTLDEVRAMAHDIFQKDSLFVAVGPEDEKLPGFVAAALAPWL